jgi:hypothetical protein
MRGMEMGTFLNWQTYLEGDVWQISLSLDVRGNSYLSTSHFVHYGHLGAFGGNLK